MRLALTLFITFTKNIFFIVLKTYRQLSTLCVCSWWRMTQSYNIILTKSSIKWNMFCWPFIKLCCRLEGGIITITKLQVYDVCSICFKDVLSGSFISRNKTLHEPLKLSIYLGNTLRRYVLSYVLGIKIFYEHTTIDLILCENKNIVESNGTWNFTIFKHTTYIIHICDYYLLEVLSWTTFSQSYVFKNCMVPYCL